MKLYLFLPIILSAFLASCSSVSSPKLNNPKWRAKFAAELQSGSVIFPSFAENLHAYRMTKNEMYLSHAEQLASTAAEKGELELVVLHEMGNKAFDVAISMNGSSTKTEYSADKTKVLFISATVAGAEMHPKGRATISLRKDLPFILSGPVTVRVDFEFTVPRESTVVFMGMTNTKDFTTTHVNSKVFQFSPTQRTQNCALDFGTMNGANTIAAIGATGRVRVTGKPHASFAIKGISRP